MKKLKIIFLLLAATLLFTACADEIPEAIVSKAPVVTDAPPVQEPYPISFDNETFEAAPATVASLSPSITEILYDLGVQDRLVGVSGYCDFPPAAENIQKIGSPARPDIDALTSLAPELLITCSPIAATDVLMLRQAGIRVLELSAPASFAELYDIYIKLSLIFNGMTDGPETAHEAISPLDEALMSAVSLGVSKSYVVVEAEAGDGLMLSPRDTLSSDMLSVFGENIWEGPSFTVTDDELFYIDPDVVFYAAGLSEEAIRKTFPYAQLIEIDFVRFERPSLRLLEVISQCAEELS